jgi:hypothetical protein
MSEVHRDGATVVVTLSSDDVLLLRQLVPQVTQLLGADEDAPEDPLAELVGMTDGAEVAPPTDPAVQRLLPDAYADDTSAGEFRRLMDGELRRTKAAALDRLLHEVTTAEGKRPQVRLDEDGAETWLRALNDIRLVLGVRLDVQEDMDALVRSLTADDPRLPLVYAYDRTTRLQDAIITALDG